MPNNNEKQIEYLQENLSSIRKIAGWTAEDLGKKIGVTKQTISNLETFKSKMNLTQYIAIRTVLDFEIENNKNNVVLSQVVTILVDNGDDLREENYKELRDVVETTAASATTGKKGVALNKTFTSLLNNHEIISGLVTLGIAIISTTGAFDGVVKSTSNWIKKILW